MNNETIATPLADKVATFKLIARNALRLKLISPRLAKISRLETDIATLVKSGKEVEKFISVEEYEISKLDTEHPNYETKKAIKEAEIKDLKVTLEDYAKEVEVINKAIVEQRDGIIKIETGETKVSLDALNELVDVLINEDAKAQVKA
ncbi:MAG: hypothetical protein WC069_05755 [Candidatus Shapirobacteria bacterium]